MSDLKKIADDVELGENLRIHDFVNLYGCRIGNNCSIAAFVEIGRGVEVGQSCKISSHAFLCEGVTLEDGVFIGPRVTFTNDRRPRAVDDEGKLLGSKDWTLEKTRVCQGASIGAGSVILCGVTIGKGALIGAGSVVTRDIPPGVTAKGNPARVQKNDS